MTKAALNVSQLKLPTAEVYEEAGHTAISDEVAVFWYEDGIPPFVAQEMERLYANFFSSCARFSGSKESSRISAFVTRKHGTVTSILLFCKEGKRVHVLNEFIAVSGDAICLFSHSVFERYPDVDVTSFRAIQPDVGQLSFPFQRYNYTEDIVLTLPDSVHKYESMLSKKMRSNIKTYLNRIKRDFPSFEFQVLEREAADDQYIRDIIRFNSERMRGKDKHPGIAEEEAREIAEAVKACGMIAIVKIDGIVCAGRILYQAGPNYFSRLNAHSPSFNEYRLGTLCNYLSICECIARNGKELHFLWGREEFKYRFLGEQRDFDELVVYRSPLHMALNGGLAVRTAINGRKRQVRLWLLDPERKDHAAIRFAKKTMRYLRRLS